jgi:hypothetical protein
MFRKRGVGGGDGELRRGEGKSGVLIGKRLERIN